MIASILTNAYLKSMLGNPLLNYNKVVFNIWTTEKYEFRTMFEQKYLKRCLAHF